MESGYPSPGAVGPRIYEAPSADGGSSGGSRHLRRLSRLLMAEEVDTSADDAPEQADDVLEQAELFKPPDSDLVTIDVDEFMNELYDTERYTDHSGRVQAYYTRYASREDISEEDHTAIEVDRMAIALHDFVEHAILNPQKIAHKDKLERRPSEIKKDALSRFDKLIGEVDDKDGLIKSFLFAIDASKWESAARVWRGGATTRINEMVTVGIKDRKTGEIIRDKATGEPVKMDERTSQIIKAAINKKGMPKDASQEEIEQALRTPNSLLRDLKLGAISDVTLNHNVKGLFLKGLETLDNIECPPQGNPASTYRDCTEAINFFVPALMAHGYKDLANDLRGAALKWFYEDPNGDAEQQHAASQRHYESLQGIVSGLREKNFRNTAVDIESRVKTEGSIREKLADEKYQGLHLVPDGVGFALVVPDEMSPEQIKKFAEDYVRDELVDGPYNIILKHPHPQEDAFENKESDVSDYKAVHMAFYYEPEDGSGDIVPFEIQVLTQEQHEMKLYGEYSDLFYKAGTKFTPEDRQYLQHLARRGKAEREMSPASTIQSIAEMIAVAPEITSVFNKLFRAVEAANGQRILVPAELENIARENPNIFDSPLGEPGDLTVLPAAKTTERQFLYALSMFGRDLKDDQNIQDALNMVKESEKGRKRKDGKTSVLEGHILPTALSALMLAIQSGKIWDSEELGPTEYMSNIVTVAILHDYVEDASKSNKDKKQDPAIILQERSELLFDIKSKFGTTIMDGVAAMTAPVEIEDDDLRRKQYAENIQANDLARLIKPADRWQNHITDLVRLAAAGKSVKRSTFNRMMGYFAKTDTYQSAYFTSKELPNAYPRVHDIIWRFAKYFGYNTKTNNE